MEGYFKKVQWDYPPSQVIFKGDGEKKFSKIQTNKLLEFGIDGESKYVVRSVELDQSTDDDTRLTLTNELDLKEELLTLEVVVEGNKTLYKYENDEFERFFFSSQDKPVTQLHYKKYNLVLNENNEVVFKKKENTGYILQLRTQVSCSPNDPDEELPKYDLESMKAYFIKTNSCNQDEIMTYVSIYDKAIFNINVIGGVNSSQLSATSYGYNPKYDFAEYNRSTSFLAGVGLELTLPSKKGSFLFETTYNSPYNSTADIITIPIPLNTTPEPEPIDFSYSYLRSSFGAKYFMFLGRRTSFFFGANTFVDIPIIKDILVHPEITRPDRGNIERKGTFKSVNANISIGMGFKMHKLSIEFRTALKSNLFRLDLEGDFANTSMQLSYLLF